MKKVASLLFFVGAVLTGCTASGVESIPSPSATATPTPSSVAGGPTFSGPYAALLAERYAKSSSTFERDALADGNVTDAERAEMIERFRSCLSRTGHRLDSFKKTGAREITAANPDEDGAVGRKQIESCEKYAGVNTVGLIYSAMATDPENTDLVPKIVACLKKHGLVGPGYSRSDYQRGLPTFPDAKRNDRVTQCNDDPLNLTKGK